MLMKILIKARNRLPLRHDVNPNDFRGLLLEFVFYSSHKTSFADQLDRLTDPCCLRTGSEAKNLFQSFQCPYVIIEI